MMAAALTLLRALTVRLVFATHGLLSVWRLYVVTRDERVWFITLALLGLLVETVVTVRKNKGHEWKWFCPSVFFLLLCVVPAVWFLELKALTTRLERHQLNVTLPRSLAFLDKSQSNSLDRYLSARISGLGVEFTIPMPLRLSDDQWLKALEQLLLLILILGRWLLPKGKLTHDQLSQLLLVYIGTAADIVEFFEAFKEEQVRHNPVLCHVILAIWSWSLLQFTLVLTAASKARRDHSQVLARFMRADTLDTCCSADVYGIIISIVMQDGPFLILRLFLIFQYAVLSYTNMFFTCKNTLVILLLIYRLTVVQLERKNPHQLYSTAERLQCGNSHTKLPAGWFDHKTTVNLIERELDPNEPQVQFTIRHHIQDEKSNGCLRNTDSQHECKNGINEQ